MSALTIHDCHTSTTVEEDDRSMCRVDTMCRVLGLHARGLTEVLAITEHDCHTSTRVDVDSMFRSLDCMFVGKLTCRQ